MAFGSMLASTGIINYMVALVSVPAALLVVATLYANNVRDIKRDRGKDAYTLAVMLSRNAKWLYVALLLGTYVVQAILILLNLLPIYTAITIVLTLLMAQMLRMAVNNSFEHLDEETSLYSLAYAALLIVGVDNYVLILNKI